MAAPAHGPKTGKDGRETGKEKAAQSVRGLDWRYSIIVGSFPT
jgi:hypothetical protein